MIIQQIQGMILKSGSERVRIPVEATFQYDSQDPLAVLMSFDYVNDGGFNTVTWGVGRELLVQGAASLRVVGQGDIRLRYDGPETGRILMCFRNPDGHAHVALNHAQVTRFLSAAASFLPLGDEHLDEAIDEAIEEILGS